MAEWHLKELQNALGKAGWRVEAELTGNDYDISATWKIARGASEQLFIDFNGLDDMVTLPVEQSFGCKVRGRTGHTLYFSRRGAKDSNQRTDWERGLMYFVTNLGSPVRFDE